MIRVFVVAVWCKKTGEDDREGEIMGSDEGLGELEEIVQQGSFNVKRLGPVSLLEFFRNSCTVNS